MNIPGSGKDFFAENRKNARNFVHPEDQDMVVSVHYKDTMLKNLSNSKSFSIEYRFIFNERVIHVRQTEIMAEDKKHIIVCIKNIEADVRAKLELMEKMQKSLTFTQIAESLASHYDMIYYVDVTDSTYVGYEVNNIFGNLEIGRSGKDFFLDSLEQQEFVNDICPCVRKFLRFVRFLSLDAALDFNGDLLVVSHN